MGKLVQEIFVFCFTFMHKSHIFDPYNMRCYRFWKEWTWEQWSCTYKLKWKKLKCWLFFFLFVFFFCLFVVVVFFVLFCFGGFFVCFFFCFVFLLFFFMFFFFVLFCFCFFCCFFFFFFLFVCLFVCFLADGGGARLGSLVRDCHI